MGSPGRKNREHLAQPFRLDAYLEQCPHCGAAVGQRCTKRYGGKTIATAVPHPQRIELSDKLKGLRGP